MISVYFTLLYFMTLGNSVIFCKLIISQIKDAKGALKLNSATGDCISYASLAVFLTVLPKWFAVTIFQDYYFFTLPSLACPSGVP